MKRIIDNKYILFGLAFLLGAGFFWIITPSQNLERKVEHVHSTGESLWTCSMHPQIRQKESGSCPICGMDLIPLEESNDLDVDPLAIEMSQSAIQLANISTTIVGKEDAKKIINLSGKIREDERLLRSQTSHFAGRIEDLNVNFTGEYVNKGSVIASIYSPELVTAQEELLEAKKLQDRQPALFSAAKEKLKNWKLSDKQISDIISKETVKERFPVYAENSGIVVSRKVNQGDYVKRGETLYETVNLSRVWVLFDLYEQDLAWVKQGDSVQFTVSSLPGETFRGKIDYIDPAIDPVTRVAKARVVLKNNKQKLKPEMFVTGNLKAGMRNNQDQIVVPKSAVMWTGTRSLVYVKLKTDQGLYFKMKEIVLGPSLGDYFIVEEGLSTGEEIATNGTFSIDAAAQLADKPSMMNTVETAHISSHSVMDINEVNVVSEKFDIDNEFKNQLIALFQNYINLKEAFVTSNLQEVKSTSTKLSALLDNIKLNSSIVEANENWKKDKVIISKNLEIIKKAEALEKAREAFYPLSDQLFHSLKRFKIEVNAYRQYCPMAFNNTGAFWLSDQEEIRNPYFGDQMLTCGNVEEEL